MADANTSKRASCARRQKTPMVGSLGLPIGQIMVGQIGWPLIEPGHRLAKKWPKRVAKLLSSMATSPATIKALAGIEGGLKSFAPVGKAF